MKYVAFLRAINVGGKHVVKMTDLKRLFETMGFTNVETFIASGNVIFDAKKASESKIEAALRSALGYEVRTFLRTPTELARIAALKDEDGTLYVGFMVDEANAEAKQKVKALCTPLDTLHADGKEVYWLCRAERFSDTKISGAAVEKALGQATTLRNITTIRKIAAKYN